MIANKADTTLPAGGTPTVLVVDDNAAALYATSRILRAAGFQVREAKTGAAALAQATGVDLVVLDVNLPDMDGFDVCRQLRARPETVHIPVLHLSATFTSSEDAVTGFRAGADSYLTRPVEPPVLLATVRTLLFARRADSVRRALGARLRTMFDLAPVGMATLDEQSHYDTVNPAFCAMLGYTAEDIVGQSALQFAMAEPITALPLPGGEEVRPVVIVVRMQRRDGTFGEYQWQLARERLSQMRILIATDVTERERLEAARQRMLESERTARQEAERGNRAKEEFLATLSHELRNPLNAILGWATVLLRKPDLPAPVLAGLQAIERNSRFQAQMISDLLDYAGISFGKIRVTLEDITPIACLRSALEIASPMAQDAGVRLVTDIQSNEVRLQGDATRIQQVVLNLLSNAIKFSPAGAQVKVTARAVEEEYVVTVSDQGRGIEPQFLPRIFERFSQEQTISTRTRGGLGIGLALVKQIIDQHNGHIEAQSAGKGLGATFMVRLPLSSGAATPSVSVTQRLRTIDFSSIRVLIVEDDPDARALTKRILEDMGVQVFEADSSAAALARLAQVDPDLLISDIGMPHEDGYELIRQLRARGFDAERLPAIALTAFAGPEDRQTALDAGYQEYLVKPLDPHLLMSKVATLSPDKPARGGRTSG